MLTDGAIRAAMKAARADGREVTLRDNTRHRGVGRLTLRIRPKASGEATAEWFVRWKLKGQRQAMAIGRWPDMGLAEARRAYEDRHRPVITKRNDPRAEAAPVGSVADLFAAYIKSLRDRGKAESAVEVERALLAKKSGGAAADELGRNRPAREVTPSEVADMLAPVFARAPSMAGHLRAYLSAAFAYGIRADNDFTSGARRTKYGLMSNPVDHLPAVPAQARTRVLTPAEVSAWWNGFDEVAPSTVSAVLRLSFLTCSRPIEAMRARPADLRRDRWTKGKTKNGGQHAAPLPPMAMAEARRLADLGGVGSLGIPELARAVRRWYEAEKGAPWQPRDLRRTARTWLEEAGEDPALLDLHFNHQTVRGGVVGNYVHAQRWADRVALAERWEAMIARVIRQDAESAMAG